MALVLHRWGEMGKHAMSLLLRLALHSGEDRHLRRITIIVTICYYSKGQKQIHSRRFLGKFLFRDVVVSLITDVMLPVSCGSVVGWCGFNEFMQLFRRWFWSKTI